MMALLTWNAKSIIVLILEVIDFQTDLILKVIIIIWPFVKQKIMKLYDNLIPSPEAIRIIWNKRKY